MKKFKELLWFLIPFLCLTAVSVAYFVCNAPNGVNYFRLLIHDTIFIIALAHTFVPAIILSFVTVVIYKIAHHFLCRKMVAGRKKHIIVFLISLIAPVCSIVIMTRVFVFVLNTIFVLQTGIIVTFVFWVIDLIGEKIYEKRAKRT